MPLMAGKELEGGHAGFSAKQNQCKMSKVEIQASSFMVSTLRPSPHISRAEEVKPTEFKVRFYKEGAR